ncbi:MAG TPA: WD40 repeat domain-containing protein, partial [Anaerolineales bacterium]|nr:WD40 repeat domain-containing protein [Anaerolineales bacterium]
EQSFSKVVQALEADYEHAREHTRLLTRAIEWDKRQHENSYLLKGAEIERAEGWQVKATGKQPAATEMQLDYILRSRKQQRIQQRRFTITIGVLLVLAVIAGIYAVDQAIKANISAQISQSNALASAAVQPGNEDIAVALAVEATRSKYAPESVYKALAQVTYPPGGIRYRIKIDEDLYFFVSPAISPDGRYVAVKNKLYDMATGEIVRTFEDAPKITVSGLFLPDGKRLILAGDRDVEEPSPDFIYLGIYDFNTGKLLQKFDTGIGVSEVQLSADGKILLAYQPDGKVTWWDLQTGKKLRTIELNGDLVTFSPDLKWMAEARSTDTGSNELVITDTQTKQVRQTITNIDTTTGNIGRLMFSHNAQEIAVSASNLSVFNVESGEVLQKFPHSSLGIQSIRYSQDDASLLTASADQTVTLWDRQTGEAIMKQTVHRGPLIVAEFVNHEKQVVSMDSNGVIMDWNVVPGNVEEIEPRSNPDERVVAISPDGSRLVAISGLYYVNYLAIFDAYTLKEISRFPVQAVPLDGRNRDEIYTEIHSYYLAEGLEEGIFCYVTAAYQSEEVISSGVNITIASLADGKIVRNWYAELGENGSIRSAVISPKGDEVYVYYTDKDNLIHFEIWNIHSGKVTKQYVTPYSGNLAYVLDRTGTRLLLATSSYDEDRNMISSSIQMIDTSRGKILFNWNKDLPIGMFFTPDSTQFVLVERILESGTARDNITVYDADTGKEVHKYSMDPGTSVTYEVHPNGRTLISASEGDMRGGGGPGTPSGITGGFFSIIKPSFQQWDFATGELLWNYPISSLPVFSPDGKRMFNNWDSNLVMWRFDSPEELVAWACVNRYVPEFTPQQRKRFNIKDSVSRCAELEP